MNGMNRAVVMGLGTRLHKGAWVLIKCRIEPPLREHLLMVDACSMPIATPPQTGAMLLDRWKGVHQKPHASGQWA